MVQFALLHTFSNLDLLKPSLIIPCLFTIVALRKFTCFMWVTVLTAFRDVLRCTISAMEQEFSMKDLGPLHHFFGISVQQRPHGLFSQQQ